MVDSEEKLDLIREAVSGDTAALEELLLAHYDRLLRRIARKLPTSLRRTVSEEDILQQTFAEAFLRIRSFQPKSTGAFYRWLATIAEHRLLDAVKSHNTAKRGGGRILADRNLKSESMDQLIELMAGPPHTASKSVARHESIAAMQVGLASLSNDHRQAIQLRYLDGMSVADTAEVMQRTPRAVRGLCYRGVKELRTVMGRSSQYFDKR